MILTKISSTSTTGCYTCGSASDCDINLPARRWPRRTYGADCAVFSEDAGETSVDGQRRGGDECVRDRIAGERLEERNQVGYFHIC